MTLSLIYGYDAKRFKEDYIKQFHLLIFLDKKFLIY